NKHRMIMQVNVRDSAEYLTDSDITFNHVGDQFKCTKSGAKVNEKLFEIGKPHNRWDSEFVVCAFTLKRKTDDEVSAGFHKNRTIMPVLEYQTTVSVEYNDVGDFFWAPNAGQRCDPELITSTDNENSGFLQDKLDVYAPPPIMCEESKFLM
ncbi:hypothetical protein PMAYCL1PPCAC_08834, partial [Pristionchus mayeri]